MEIVNLVGGVQVPPPTPKPRFESTNGVIRLKAL